MKNLHRTARTATHFLRDLSTKEPSRASRAYAPRINLVRIGPHEVTKRAFMRHFLCSSDDSYLIQRSHVRTQPAVNAQYSPVDDRCEV